MNPTDSSFRTWRSAGRRGLLAVLTLAAAVALSADPHLVALAAPTEEPASAAPTAGPPVPRDRYLGRWNYDQPDRDTGRNVAVIQCPATTPGCVNPGPGGGPLVVPQVGDLVLSADPGSGGVVGRTDQGCTWHFAVRSRSLELSPTPQFCFNQVIGSGYTITRWSITVRGDHERETITAVSHNPTGDDDFMLADGRRTRAPETARPGDLRRFRGTWEYTPADPQTRVNIAVNRTVGPEGEQVSFTPQAGTVDFTPGPLGTVVAHTGDGCRWTLVVRGNTARLAPAAQVCQLADSTVTLRHWTIASDGRRQATVRSGVVEDATSTTNFVLGIGDLARLSRP